MRTAARTCRIAPRPVLALALLMAMGSGCSPGSVAVPDPGEASAETTPAAPPAPPPPVHPPERAAEDRRPPSPGHAPSQLVGWWRSSLVDVFDELEEAAAAGDMRAASVLGTRSAQCRTVLRRDTPESLIDEHRDVPTVEVDASSGETSFSRENRERQLREKLSQYEDCAVLGQERIAAGAEWLERAARSGPASARRASARLSFIRMALDEYETRGALIADIEEASRRRKLAREWLEQLVRQGDENALDRYVRELDSGNGLYARDQAASMAHEYALQLVRSRRTGDFDRLWREGPQRYGERTPAEWNEITTRGRDIYREHFVHAPAWRQR